VTLVDVELDDAKAAIVGNVVRSVETMNTVSTYMEFSKFTLRVTLAI